MKYFHFQLVKILFSMVPSVYLQNTQDKRPKDIYPRTAKTVYKGILIESETLEIFGLWRCIEHAHYSDLLNIITCEAFLWILFFSAENHDRTIKSLSLSVSMIHHFPKQYTCKVCTNKNFFIKQTSNIAFEENITLKLKSSFVMLHLRTYMRVSCFQ